jgi:hypothetical protein
MIEINSDDLASACARKALTARNTPRRVEEAFEQRLGAGSQDSLCARPLRPQTDFAANDKTIRQSCQIASP